MNANKFPHSFSTIAIGVEKELSLYAHFLLSFGTQILCLLYPTHLRKTMHKNPDYKFYFDVIVMSITPAFLYYYLIIIKNYLLKITNEVFVERVMIAYQIAMESYRFCHDVVLSNFNHHCVCFHGM